MVMAYGQMGIYVGQESLILGLDPGRDKTGFAFVNDSGELMASGIFPTVERDKFFAGNHDEFIIEYTKSCELNKVSLIALGNGTGSKEFNEYVQKKVSCKIMIIDERNSTLEARKLYWKIHRPKFLTRLIPESLRVPDRVIDDLAAFCIALRALEKL